MCKKQEATDRAINRAKSDTPISVALYETKDGSDDLVGIIEVLEDVVVKLYDVNSEGELSLYGTAPHNFNVNLPNVLKRFHICRQDELKFYLPMYHMLAL